MAAKTTVLVEPAQTPAELGQIRLGEVAAVAAFAAGVLLTFSVSAGLLWTDSAPPWSPAVHAAALLGVCLISYGVLVEPYRVVLRRETLRSPALKAPLRVAHISDTHVRRWSAVEESLLERLREARPDLVLMTGDYTASRFVPADFLRLLRGLAGVAPVYASLGNSEESRPVQCLPPPPGVTWLDDELVGVELGANRLRLYGVNAGNEALVRRAGLEKAPDEFGVCLYHYPDLLTELAKLPYDLVLCGHTHGGQVRLPFLGALVSMSRAGTAFARGFFRAKGKAACVSAGVGCESYGLPRLRFLCPPEVVVIDLSPADDAEAPPRP
ncbi:MAG: metallophosphoesterase [Elusimicrobia bacterium]|nr:metallophosphoesterase [Elusimicrobiota bacterium]